MKTAERNSRIRWADMFSVCANGTAGRNRRCSSTWGWKQEKLQRWERYFLLTSPSIEPSYGVFQRFLSSGNIRTLETINVLSLAVNCGIAVCLRAATIILQLLKHGLISLSYIVS